jgi:integrase
MSGGRPRTAIGTFGKITVQRRGTSYVATTRHRDHDGKLRPVSATGRTAAIAEAKLKQRIRDRRGYGPSGILNVSSAFTELAELWLADVEARDLAEGSKRDYGIILRRHVRPAFENFALGEITTGRVEWFLRAESAISSSRARHSRNVLSQVLNFALRHDAIPRNPVTGTSRLSNKKAPPKALTLRQIAAIRHAAQTWRVGESVPGPPPDGQVRDLTEVLLGTGLRIGEALALRPCDVRDTAQGMVLHIQGTIVHRPGSGFIRQAHPKTDHSERVIAVPEFAARVLRPRISATLDPQRTIFANRNGGPLSPDNARRTFRAFLKLAALDKTGISPRWYRRTAATIVARGAGKDASAAFLGHSSAAITEAHYIQPDPTVDLVPAQLIERTLRPDNPDGALLALPAVPGEDEIIRRIDAELDVESESAGNERAAA